MLVQLGVRRRYPLRRGALAVAVLLAHIALIIMVARSTTSVHKRAPETPILVSLVAPPPPRAPQNLTLPKPTVAFIRPILAPPPELQLPTDHIDVVATAAQSVVGQRPSAASISSPDPSPHLQLMSTVAYVERPAPAYPRQSRLAHEEGLVVLRVLIDESGHARDIDVYRSSGHVRLDKEACAAVARALFKPYLDGGVARAAIAMVPIEFSLRDKSS